MPTEQSPAACTCDPEAYESGPEGQRRYFEDRGCPVHGDPEWIAAYCGASGPHRPHEWLDGVRRRDCPGYKEDAAIEHGWLKPTFVDGIGPPLEQIEKDYQPLAESHGYAQDILALIKEVKTLRWELAK